MGTKPRVEGIAKASEDDGRQQVERELDEALEDTFPASDPVTVGHATADEDIQVRTDRRPPLLDVELIKQLARKLRRTDAK